MENIVKGTDMKKIDSYTINEIGIPSLVLMERAAKSVADLIDKNERKQKNNITIQVIAGIGNNGADGVAIGRMLYLLGYNICIFVMGDKEQFQNTLLKYEGLWERLALFCMYIPFVYKSMSNLFF